MGFPRQEYWSGEPYPSPGDLPDPGIEPMSAPLQADSWPSEPPGTLPYALTKSHHLLFSSWYISVYSKLSKINMLSYDLKKYQPVNQKTLAVNIVSLTSRLPQPQ